MLKTVIPNEQSEVSVVRMKLLIWTDNVLENYGFWEWGNHGPCPQRWKVKPALDYVLRDLTDEEIATIESKVIPVLKEEIEQDDEERNVTINTWQVVNDDYEEDFIEIIRPYDDPEQPFTLRYVPK